MKRLLISALLLGFAGGAFAQGDKVAYTNVEYILLFMDEAKVAQEMVTTYERKLEEKMNVKRDYYQTKLTELQEKAQKNELSAEELETEKQTMLKLEETIQQDYMDAQQDLAKKQQEVFAPILEKVQVAIEAVAKREGYTYVLNASPSGASNVLFGPEEANLTDKILKELGIDPPKTAPKTDANTGGATGN